MWKSPTETQKKETTMPATTHSATFTWPGNSANTVFVTGAWDNWSGNSHALDKQSDGGFVGHVDLPFGQTYSYKYVVDGGESSVGGHVLSLQVGWLG